MKTITQFDLQKIIIIIIILFSHYIVDFKQAYGIMKLLQQRDNICDIFEICFEKLGLSHYMLTCYIILPERNLLMFGNKLSETKPCIDADFFFYKANIFALIAIDLCSEGSF